MRRVALIILALLAGSADAQVAVYRGATYTPTSFPTALRCRCGMCQSIRAQWASSSVPRAVQVTTTDRLSPLPSLSTPTVVSSPLEAVDEWVPMPMGAVEAILDLVPPKPKTLITDPGCGDGRILTTAAIKYGVKSFGVEINPETAKIARDRVAVLGLDDFIVVTTGDSRNYDFYKADTIYCYLYTELIDKLITLGRIPESTTIVSYLHPFVGGEKIEHKGHVFYVRMP